MLSWRLKLKSAPPANHGRADVGRTLDEAVLLKNL